MIADAFDAAILNEATLYILLASSLQNAGDSRLGPLEGEIMSEF